VSRDKHLSKARVSHIPVLMDDPAPRPPRRRARIYLPAAAALVAALGLTTSGGLSSPKTPTASVSGEHAPASAQEAAKIASADGSPWMLDPTPSLGPQALKSWQDTPLGPTFQRAATRADTIIEPLSPPEEDRAQPQGAPKAQQTTQLVPTVPLPVPRPAELRLQNAPQPPSLPDQQAARQAKTAVPPAIAEDNRSFLEKVFGLRQPSGPALAYAALGRDPVDTAPSRRLSPAPGPAAGAGTAVYDISARVVYMPNGERLEAHSGLGETMDDPRYVHMRMRGATPPGTYDLTEREQLFHGARALRLNPVGGSAAIYGRAGLLAHPYLLGPTGASNGCVSVKDYNRFLQAYLRGEVRRLVVVSGQGQDGLPGLANKLFGISTPSASRGNT
jgi:hypothetical protein